MKKTHRYVVQAVIKHGLNGLTYRPLVVVVTLKNEYCIYTIIYSFLKFTKSKVYKDNKSQTIHNTMSNC